ncbi:LPS-assembly protein LptD [Sphingomonas sp. 28-63-12]|uniref:LPS-assembly protein LptD n=1 Tax=Sphingomonas sp. 28-63-12 TaxID=1970434 RepID=UPI000BC57FBC|nr:MAG: organic solvent tolerance protein [Sphingomonas sp. 28-63-12]
MTRSLLLASCALAAIVAITAPAAAQDLQDRPIDPAPATEVPAAAEPNQVQFSADGIEYDSNADIVTARGDVRMHREGDRLRADTIVWNRKTGLVTATGNIVVTNPGGDAAYGDTIELTDSLKDGVIENMLVVLDQGGRLAADRGSRKDGVVTLDDAAYTPCSVVDSNNCPKEPSWKITAARVVYDPVRKRIFYKGARVNIFGIASIPLPAFSNPVGDGTDNGFLTPDLKYSRVNGAEAALPYYFRIAPNRGLTLTPRIYSAVLPMLQAEYRALTSTGAYRVTAYGTVSDRTDTLIANATTAQNAFRGYFDASGKFQLDPYWSITGSIRVTTDRTFLRRYDISRDDILRNSIKVERIDPNSYLSIAGWAVQTLRVGDRQGLQPYALPEIDYRRRIENILVDGGRLNLQLNSLAIGRAAGQDTQRAFASAQWDLRRITRFGQEVTLTAFARGDLYNASDTVATSVISYRGSDGFHARAIAALALDVKWPLIGEFLGGTQRLTPRVQVVTAPALSNLAIPNEDSRAVDLEDSNLFALNRFPGYDRVEDSTRFTYGVDWSFTLPDFTFDANIGQSYRLSTRPTLLPDGTGLSDRVSDIVGRNVVRYKDLFTLTQRYRLDKDGLALRRNEIDATIGTRGTYLLLGYLRLNRNITPSLEDLRDREEARVGGRLQFARFWSVFGSAVIDLTDRREDPTSLANGFSPVRHRIGFAYEDDCLRLGLTWKRDYQDTGDARRGDSFLLTLAFKNLGR